MTDDDIHDGGFREPSQTIDETIRQKLGDAEVPGAVVYFDPDEAERAGAFVEDALSEDDAREAEDGLDLPTPPQPERGKLSLFAAARNA